MRAGFGAEPVWVRVMRAFLRKFPLTPEQTINVLTEFGPLVALFVFTFIFDFEIGTWALVISTVVALAVSLKFIARVPIMPFLGGGISIAFGTASLMTHNPMWVQIKVTIFNTLFAALLMISLSRGKSLLQHIFGKTFKITPEGWRTITINWAVFFIFTAIINEVVRQFLSPQMWAAFKVFFIMPVAGLFGIWQAKLVRRYQMVEPALATITAAHEPATVPAEHSAHGPRELLHGHADMDRSPKRADDTSLPADR